MWITGNDDIDRLCGQIQDARDELEKEIKEKEVIIDSQAEDITTLEDLICKQEERIDALEREVAQYTFVDRWEKKRHEE